MSIQDNSYFIEEAFNQEDRVVQHIFHLQYFEKPRREMEYSFTQEWPFWGSKHQLSYEIPYLSGDTYQGVGDMMVNYRYQLFDKVDGIAIAPRLSLIFPTGDKGKGLGVGVMGCEINLPVSKRLSEGFVLHANAGLWLFPNVRAVGSTGIQVKHTLSAYWLGASGIWLLLPNMNLMLEYIRESASEIDENGDLAFSTMQIFNPGVRLAVNYDNLQIVPGISLPSRIGEARTVVGVYGYISFEHGF